MRTLLYMGAVILAVLMMSNSSCQKESLGEPKTINFNQDFELGLNDSIIVESVGNRLSVQLVEISDSRCPEGVQCVWAGNATVRIDLKGQDGSTGSAALCIGQCTVNSGSPDAASVTLGSEVYVIRLKEVRPYPKNGDKEKSKTAVLIVSKFF